MLTLVLHRHNRKHCCRYRTESPADCLANGALLGKQETWHGQRQDAISPRVAVVVGLVGVGDKHVHRLWQRVLEYRFFLSAHQLAVQSPDVHPVLGRRIDQVRMFLADVHHLDVLNAVRFAVDVQVDLEVDQPIIHVRDRPWVHLTQVQFIHCSRLILITSHPVACKVLPSTSLYVCLSVCLSVCLYVRTYIS